MKQTWELGVSGGGRTAPRAGYIFGSSTCSGDILLGRESRVVRKVFANDSSVILAPGLMSKTSKTARGKAGGKSGKTRKLKTGEASSSECLLL